MADNYNMEGIVEVEGDIIEFEEKSEGVLEQKLRPTTIKYTDISPWATYRGGEQVDAWDRSKEEAKKVLLPWLAKEKGDKPPQISFLDGDEPDADGIYQNLFYTNGAGNLENMYGMTMDQGIEEAIHREKIRKNTGEPYYFIQSDQYRYRGWEEGRPDTRARSTESNDFRLKGTVMDILSGSQSMAGTLQFDMDADTGKISVERGEVGEPSSSILNPTGLLGTVARGVTETANIAFGAGTSIILGFQELEKGYRYNVAMHGKGLAPGAYQSPKDILSGVYFPTRDEINDMLTKPEADMANQFASLIVPNTMMSGLLIKTVGTFRNGKKIFNRAAKDTLKEMRDQGEKSWAHLRGPERILAKRDYLEKMRRQLNDRLEKELGQSYLRATGLRKMITKGRFDAHINPKKWLAENGLAEVGIATGMVLSHRNFANSGDPNDPYKMFGYMNTAIGVVGALASGSFPAAATGIGNVFGINKLIRAGIETFKPSDFNVAMSALEEIATGGKGLSGALDNLKPKERKRVLQMVDDIYQIKDPKIREEIIDNARESQRVIQDLIKISPEDAEWIKTVHMSLGQMFNVSNLMAAEEYLIRTARGGGTVAFNLVDASAQIQMKRVQAAQGLEKLLEKAGAMDISGLDSETKAFLNNVKRLSKNMNMDNAANAVHNANFIETGMEVQLSKMGVETDLDIQQLQKFDEMVDHYGNAIDGMTDELQKAAALKKLQIMVEQRNAFKISKMQEKLASFGDVDPKTGKARNTEQTSSAVAQTVIHENGLEKLATGGRLYKNAKAKLKGVELAEGFADNYFLKLDDALSFKGTDQIIGRDVPQVRSAVESALEPITKDILDDVLRSLEPEDAAFEALQKNINTLKQGSSNLDIITMLIRAKQNGKGVGNISAEVLENLNIKMDYLDIDAINQLVNQQITGAMKGLNRNARSRLDNSALSQFFKEHDNAYRDWENTVGKEAIDASGIRDAKQYWKDVVLPATYNNKIWTAIKTTTDAGGKLNYENAFKYMEDVGVLSDPDEFIKDITRAFGKYDPNMPNPVTGQMGMHVLGDEGKQIVGNLLTNYVGSKIAKEATKKIDVTKLKPTKVEDIVKTLDKFGDDSALEGLELSGLRFGDEFDQGLIDQLNVLDEGLTRVGLGDLVDNAVFTPRDYNKVLRTNADAQESFTQALDVIKSTKKRYDPKLAALQKKEDIFIKEIDMMARDAKSIDSPAAFYEKFVVQNQGDTIKKLREKLTTSIGGRRPQMSVEEFDEIVRRQVASGIRKLSEEGPMALEKRAVQKQVVPGSGRAEKTSTFGQTLEDVTEKGDELIGGAVSGVKKLVGKAETLGGSKPNLEMKMTTRVSGAKLLRNLDDNADTLKEILGEEHFNNMRIVGRVLEVIQRVPVSADSPEVLKASKMTIGGMTSRLYAVFSGRVSWRYVGAEALFLNMARNDAYAITAILANPEATQAIAYMAVTGKPIINKITTTDKMTAWIPEVFVASTDEYKYQWERGWERDRYVRRAEGKEQRQSFEKQMDRVFDMGMPSP